ncbi:MAG: TonB-dependent receptor plug domain-containing protein, partial [Flavobacteriales bacterium]|nr:TonB-dependent receptor plug domain-containing protein [Flavobacteriales bacterium]
MRKGLLLAFLLPVLIYGQNSGLVKGVIQDINSQEPLVGASVVLLGNEGFGTVSDLDGNYLLKLAPGLHKLIFNSLGYSPDTLTINVSAGSEFILNAKLTSQAQQLDMMVVSAGRFEQKIEELTVSMDVLKPNIVENKNTTSIETALEQTPGLVILDNEPQIRGGSGFNFGVGSRVAIMVDDLPLLTGDAGRPEWGFIPVENLEQIEVIKGAASVMYGSSALSGVINVRTAYPKDKPTTKVNLYSGVYSEPRFKPAKWWDRDPIYYGMNFFHSRKIKKLDLVVGGNFQFDPGFIGPP